MFAKSVCVDHEFNALEPLCVLSFDEVIPDSHDRTQPTVAQHTPKTGDGASASKGANSKGPTTMEADVPEPDRDPNLFDNDEEYAGVDDEHLYMAGPSTQPSDNAQPDDGSTDPFADIGGIPHDAEVNDQDPQELHVLHDLENPNIAKGSQFPNIIAFRKAIRHYAVSVGFEFARLKIDKTRFIAHCAAKGCSWRIHASTIYDKKTIEV